MAVVGHVACILSERPYVHKGVGSGRRQSITGVP
jgi:hypothetical protein